MRDQNSTTGRGSPAAERRTFEAMDALVAHLQTCPRWWFRDHWHVQHCREHDALSAVFQTEIAALADAHRAATDEFHTSWRGRYEAHRQRRRWRVWRGLRSAAHTPYTPPHLAVYDDCTCCCVVCGDGVAECACEDGPAYPAVAVDD